MAKQRKRVIHTATFEKRLAEEAINSKRPLKRNLPVAWHENFFFGVLGRPRRPRTSMSG